MLYRQRHVFRNLACTWKHGVPDKPAEACAACPGSLHKSFYSMHFPISNSFICGVVTLQFITGLAAFRYWYCDHNEVPSKDNQISQNPLHQRNGRKDYTGGIVIKPVRLTDKMEQNPHPRLEYQSKINGSSESDLLLYQWVHKPHFIKVPSLMPVTWVQQNYSRMFWCIRIWQLSEV